MLSGMLYCVYIIQCLDRCDVDVAASVAIVVLIRGWSEDGPRPQTVPVIRSADNPKNLRITVRKRTSPHTSDLYVTCIQYYNASWVG